VKLAEVPLDTARKGLAEKLSETTGIGLTKYVYVALFVEGKLMWRSSKVELHGGELELNWSEKDEGAFTGLVWDPGDNVTVKVFLHVDPQEAGLKTGGQGAVGGAGAGALIGGLLAGAFTGGLGAPAGAAIGALIGGAAGGGVGVAAGALSSADQVVMETTIKSSEQFPLYETLARTEKDSTGNQWTQSVEFVVTEMKEPVPEGGLQLKKHYLVRLKEINLSECAVRKADEDPKGCEYYVVLRRGDEEYRFRTGSEEAGSRLRIDAGTPIDPDVYTPLLNTGEETEVRIYERDWYLNPNELVFSSKVARLDGRTWAFQGTIHADDAADTGSYVVFETYPIHLKPEETKGGKK
jgi:hypothetical protein